MKRILFTTLFTSLLATMSGAAIIRTTTLDVPAAHHAHLNPDGSFFVYSTPLDSQTQATSIKFVKYSPTGSQIWQWTSKKVTNFKPIVDDAGDAYLVEWTYTSGETTLVKISGTNGSTLSRQTVEGDPVALEKDPQNRIYLLLQNRLLPGISDLPTQTNRILVFSGSRLVKETTLQFGNPTKDFQLIPRAEGGMFVVAGYYGIGLPVHRSTLTYVYPNGTATTTRPVASIGRACYSSGTQSLIGYGIFNGDGLQPDSPLLTRMKFPTVLDEGLRLSDIVDSSGVNGFQTGYPGDLFVTNLQPQNDFVSCREDRPGFLEKWRRSYNAEVGAGWQFFFRASNAYGASLVDLWQTGVGLCQFSRETGGLIAKSSITTTNSAQLNDAGHGVAIQDGAKVILFHLDGLKQLQLSAPVVSSGGSLTVTVSVYAPEAEPRTLRLSSNSGSLSLPTEIVLPGGQTSVSFTAQAGTVASAETVSIAAAYPGVSADDIVRANVQIVP